MCCGTRGSRHLACRALPKIAPSSSGLRGGRAVEVLSSIGISGQTCRIDAGLEPSGFSGLGASCVLESLRSCSELLRTGATECRRKVPAQEGSWELSRVSIQVELCEVVRLLALPGRDAISEVAAPGNTADRLAHRFDEAYTAWVSGLRHFPEAGLLEALQRIDGALLELARPECRELWADAALCRNAAWEDLRALAREAAAHLQDSK